MWSSFETEMELIHKGKVRDLYIFEGDLLMVASDRISAYDEILNSEIPKKGIILTQITLFFLQKFESTLLKYNIKSAVIDKVPPKIYSGRAIIAKKCKPLQIEAIVRGYLFGSAFNDYIKVGSVGDETLSKDLQLASKLLKPIFTPSTKAEVGLHDINISFSDMSSICGEELSNRIKEFSIELYNEASAYAFTKGMVLCDTKFEFGLLDGELYLIDEVLTPDSSRYWNLEDYKLGISPPSYDKQIVRDYLTNNNLKGKADVALPREIIELTSQKYIECYEKLVGSAFTY
eukprot:NODE_1103_length_2207_cov_0.753321.p1 type:complete len:289 gc:universal NODE_1103_length_2207_cov_0.753321:1281-415(-)